MAQFTVKSLARLLAQVEREVLVGALQEAGLTQLLRTDTIETIEELQSLLNLASNIRVFGPSFLGLEFDSAIARFLEAAPITASILSTVEFVVDTVRATNRRLQEVKDLVEDFTGKAVEEAELFDFKGKISPLLNSIQVAAQHGLEHLSVPRKRIRLIHVQLQFEQVERQAAQANTLVNAL